jgi:hypothetical protein
MTAEIVTLIHPDDVPRLKAIEMLERYLAKAKAGEIESVALAALTDDGTARVAFSEHADNLALLGSIRLLDEMLVSAVLREGE